MAQLQVRREGLRRSLHSRRRRHGGHNLQPRDHREVRQLVFQRRCRVVGEGWGCGAATQRHQQIHVGVVGSDVRDGVRPNPVRGRVGWLMIVVVVVVVIIIIIMILHAPILPRMSGAVTDAAGGRGERGQMVGAFG